LLKRKEISSWSIYKGWLDSIPYCYQRLLNPNKLVFKIIKTNFGTGILTSFSFGILVWIEKRRTNCLGNFNQNKVRKIDTSYGYPSETTNPRPNTVALETFPSSAFKSHTWIFATTTKISTDYLSMIIYIITLTIIIQKPKQMNILIITSFYFFPY